MNTIKWFRNGMAFSFSWLVILVTVLAFVGGMEQISTAFLGKLMVFCLVSSGLFAAIFSGEFFKKHSFLFRLSIFAGIFIPVEIGCFYWIGIFGKDNTLWKWLIFVGSVICFYMISLLLDRFYFAKQGEIYTFRLKEYQRKRSMENNGSGIGEFER